MTDKRKDKALKFAAQWGANVSASMGTYEIERVAEAAMREGLRSQMAGTGKAIAAELGDGWHTLPSRDGDTGDYRIELAHFDGRRIMVYAHVYQWDGKVEISGCYPQMQALGISDLGYGTAQPRISVTLARGGAVIAGEIKRRFLDEFTALHNNHLARIHETALQRAHRGAMALRLAEVAGVDLSLSTRHDGGFRYATYEDFQTSAAHGMYCFSHVNAESVDLTIHDCPEALAVQVFELINRYRAHLKKLCGE